MYSIGVHTIHSTAMNSFPFQFAISSRIMCKQNLLGLCHEVIIEVPLALGEAAHDDMFVLFRHLLFHIILQAPQQERTENLPNHKHRSLMRLFTNPVKPKRN